MVWNAYKGKYKWTVCLAMLLRVNHNRETVTLNAYEISAKDWVLNCTFSIETDTISAFDTFSASVKRCSSFAVSFTDATFAYVVITKSISFYIFARKNLSEQKPALI